MFCNNQSGAKSCLPLFTAALYLQILRTLFTCLRFFFVNSHSHLRRKRFSSVAQCIWSWRLQTAPTLQHNNRPSRQTDDIQRVSAAGINHKSLVSSSFLAMMGHPPPSYTYSPSHARLATAQVPSITSVLFCKLFLHRALLSARPSIIPLVTFLLPPSNNVVILSFSTQSSRSFCSGTRALS